MKFKHLAHSTYQKRTRSDYLAALNGQNRVDLLNLDYFRCFSLYNHLSFVLKL